MADLATAVLLDSMGFTTPAGGPAARSLCRSTAADGEAVMVFLVAPPQLLPRETRSSL